MFVLYVQRLYIPVYTRKIAELVRPRRSFVLVCIRTVFSCSFSLLQKITDTSLESLSFSTGRITLRQKRNPQNGMVVGHEHQQKCDRYEYTTTSKDSLAFTSSLDEHKWSCIKRCMFLSMIECKNNPEDSLAWNEICSPFYS